MTQIIGTDEAGIAQAAALLDAGEIVAIPTETVYGLAASAFSESAVQKIFAVKGRPADNPLIVHVADPEMAALAGTVSAEAKTLMDAFWPGPLSIILPKLPRIPAAVSAGLETVAVRMPNHPAALEIIRRTGPLAAPSANTSGKPSPTLAAHVASDLEGKIPLIVDGGACMVGVESTVIDMRDTPTILRPGAITIEQIRKLVPDVQLHAGIMDDAEHPASPGMKYRHYAPRAPVFVFMGPDADVARKIRERYDYDIDHNLRPMILGSAQAARAYGGLNFRSLGGNAAAAERALFRELRLADDLAADIIYFHYEESMGAAVKNRICKAAAESDLA